MRVRVEGPESKKHVPLVFIHGAGGAATVWLDLFRHFERTRIVVAPDLPGHGQSDPWHAVEDRGRVAQYAEAIGTACAHVGVKKAILVGHSMGGLIALKAAAMNPEKVAGVIAIGATNGMKPDAKLLAALEQNPTKQAEILAELGWSPATPKDTIARWFRTVTCASPEITLADLRGVAACEPLRPNVRVQLLAGRDDLLCPPSLVEAGQKSIPDAAATFFDDAGHHPHLEQPTAVIEAIERFATFV
jgi:pimeloyl-ACP methyl ester carboxylesterase